FVRKRVEDAMPVMPGDLLLVVCDLDCHLGSPSAKVRFGRLIVRKVPYMPYLVNVISLTPTSYIVLGLISQAGEAPPYSLNQMAAATVGNFFSIPHSQLYAEPERLAGGGYL